MHWPLFSFASTQPRWRHILFVGIVTCAAAFIALAALAGLEVRTKYAGKIFHPDDAPEAAYGVVLGASVDSQTGAPSQALTDRLETAIDLLKKRRIMGVIITGDDGRWRSDERTAMLKYLRDRHVPNDIIFIDEGAYRTFDSCENLSVRGFQNVALISQRFHLPRALYLCNELGVRAVGVTADQRWYAQLFYFWMRDVAASPFAYLDVRGVTVIKKGPAV